MIKLFLAAMSSSKSDDVTKSVRLFVRPFVRSHFFSFSVLGVLFSPKGVQRCFKKVLRMFEVSMKFKDVSSKF